MRPLVLLLLVVVALAGGSLATLPVGGARLTRPSTAAAHPEPGDRDGDGVKDEVDNCPDAKNGAQVDTDGDKAGDACDADDDGDGVADSADNCRTVVNPGQENTDGDAFGDACPPVDSDGDGRVDGDDNCRDVANPDQVDTDGDDKGDICDRDLDGDRYDNDFDNCPTTYNPDQADGDGDAIGTACDPQEALPPSGTPTTTGTTTTPGGPDIGTTPARDTRAPRLTLALAARTTAARAARAITVRAGCSEACTLTATLRVGRSTRARGAWALGEAGTTYLFVRPTGSSARDLLRRSRSRRATLTVTAVDAAGNATRRTRTLRIG